LSGGQLLKNEFLLSLVLRTAIGYNGDQQYASKRLRAGCRQKAGGIATGEFVRISGERRGQEAGDIGDGADEGTAIAMLPSLRYRVGVCQNSEMPAPVPASATDQGCESTDATRVPTPIGEPSY